MRECTQIRRSPRSARGAELSFSSVSAREDAPSLAARHSPPGAALEALQHLDRVRFYQQHDALVLDPVSVRNLELLAPIFADDAVKSAPTTLVGTNAGRMTGKNEAACAADASREVVERWVPNG